MGFFCSLCGKGIPMCSIIAKSSKHPYTAKPVQILRKSEGTHGSLHSFGRKNKVVRYGAKCKVITGIKNLSKAVPIVAETEPPVHLNPFKTETVP